MAIETFEYIDDLNVANPTATDNVSEGDDHLRGLKTTLKNTFPNVTGAINATETELNYVDGVTSAIQTQLDTKLSSVADNSVTLAKMAGGTDGNLITYDASGDPAYVTTGTSGQVLTSGGTGVAPTFQTAAGGGKVLQYKAVVSTSQSTMGGGSWTYTGFSISLDSAPASSSTVVIKCSSSWGVTDTDRYYTYIKNSTAGTNGTTSAVGPPNGHSDAQWDYLVNENTNLWTVTGRTTVDTYQIWGKTDTYTVSLNKSWNGNYGSNTIMEIMEIGV